MSKHDPKKPLEPFKINQAPGFIRPSPGEKKSDETEFQKAPEGVNLQFLEGESDELVIEIPDGLFNAPCKCVLRKSKEGLEAFFFVPDKNTCRLLEAEQGRLLRLLSGRGIKVARVEVRVDVHLGTS